MKRDDISVVAVRGIGEDVNGQGSLSADGEWPGPAIWVVDRPPRRPMIGRGLSGTVDSAAAGRLIGCGRTLREGAAR